MDKSLSVRKIQIYYYRYKDTPYFMIGVFGLILFSSLLLILFVIVPQISQIVSLQREINAVEESIAIMHDNREYINSISEIEEAQRTDTVLAALPLVKDYAGAYSAILNAATTTGVSLSNFEYEVGSLDTSELQGNAVAEMKVMLSVSGSPHSVNDFLDQLTRSLPLSTTNVIAGSGNLSNIEIAFFYGGEQLIQVDPRQPIPTLTAEKQSLINTLSSYRPQIEPVFIQSQVATESGFSEPPF